MQAFERWQQIRARAVAREARILIARVDPILDACALQSSAKIRSPLPKEGADDAAATFGDSGEPRQTCAAGQVQEDRLRLIIGGVAGQDHRIGTRNRGHLLQKGIARGASGLLDAIAALSCQSPDIGPFDRRLQAQRSGSSRDKLRVVRGTVSEAVVQVRDHRSPAMGWSRRHGQVHEGRRIGSAGDREDERGAVRHAKAKQGSLEPRGEGRHRVWGIGSGGRIRTTDQGLMSPLLYH